MLERARLVRRRRLGREHFLSFDGAALDDAAAWIERQRAFWTSRLDALDSVGQPERTSRHDHRNFDQRARHA
jgi:hypothetical protein